MHLLSLFVLFVFIPSAPAATFTGWAAQIIARRDPPKAEQLLSELVWNCQTNRLFCEWWNFGTVWGLAGSSNYLTSAGCPAAYATTETLAPNSRLIFPNLTITTGHDAPTAPEPNGSLYLRTSGQMYLRANNTWLLK